MHHAGGRDPLHAERRGVDQGDVRQVEGGQELVVEGRPLAAVGVVGLQRRRGLRVRHHGVHAGARSEEHTSELQSLMRISYAVFCLTKKTNNTNSTNVLTSYN